MKINGKPTRTIVPEKDGQSVRIIDQSVLPHILAFRTIANIRDAEQSIREMWVRGAPLIGVTAAYGFALAMNEDSSDRSIDTACDFLLASRPTAVNLRWALNRMKEKLAGLRQDERPMAAFNEAGMMAEEDVHINEMIGKHGATLLSEIWHKRREAGARQLNILTHCNAGWLATVDWGTALAPVYKAHELSIPIHVWVDETRPRNQGAALTACELNWAGIDHTVIADNSGGHLMQHGLVDIVIVGTDRTTRSGDVCNKIGTYLKALAAKDNNVPFYVGLPGSTIDWNISNGIGDIPIEERSSREVTHITGKSGDGQIVEVQLTPTGSKAANYGFDVTPARLVTGLITENGICQASHEGLTGLYPERRN